mmetsp:Transcript_12067/g.30412  ORF Transcript_12067/g.30412 Transcript_12067/m.30412 type:complete len:268 (-) Transcript_12067:194-997(-)
MTLSAFQIAMAAALSKQPNGSLAWGPITCCRTHRRKHPTNRFGVGAPAGSRRAAAIVSHTQAGTKQPLGTQDDTHTHAASPTWQFPTTVDKVSHRPSVVGLAARPRERSLRGTLLRADPRQRQGVGRDGLAIVMQLDILQPVDAHARGVVQQVDAHAVHVQRGGACTQQRRQRQAEPQLGGPPHANRVVNEVQAICELGIGNRQLLGVADRIKHADIRVDSSEGGRPVVPVEGDVGRVDRHVRPLAEQPRVRLAEDLDDAADAEVEV